MNFSMTDFNLSNHKLIVQKYGGATLATPEKIKQAAKRIHELHQSGLKVVVVVSAMGHTTNELISLARQVSERPQLRELDMLLTVGERISMSLMSMALNDLGCQAISFTGSQAGILTDDSHVNAQIIDVKAFRVEEALNQNKVVIMAGFQGVSPQTKEITTLGRGGSDTSAVAMAGYLKADRCEILKDVDCVYTADPKLVPDAQAITHLNYLHLLEMTSWGAKVLHHRSVEMAHKHNVKLYVGPAAGENNKFGTLITSDFEFQLKKAIAVNSFQKILFLQTELSVAEFNSYLIKNQISQPKLLLQKNDCYYFSGPDETLSAIENFYNLNKSNCLFKILNHLLSSVSITFSEYVGDADLEYASQLLVNKKIDLIENFCLMHSLHFFIPQGQRNEAVRVLHKII